MALVAQVGKVPDENRENKQRNVDMEKHPAMRITVVNLHKTISPSEFMSAIDCTPAFGGPARFTAPTVPAHAVNSLPDEEIEHATCLET